MRSELENQLCARKAYRAFGSCPMELPITPSKQQQQQQQTSFCFPILKNSVILQCMSELGYDLNERELLEPQKYRDRVRSIFRELVCLA